MKRLILLFVGLATAFASSAQNPSWMRYPAISPDGTQIVFSYQGDLYLVSRDGGEARPLTTHPAYDYEPVWSRDGSKIAFASDRYGNYDVFVIDANGGTPTRLTYASSGDHPSDFTPDGSAVLFSASRQDAASNRQFPSGGLRELYQVPVNGGRPVQLLTTAAENARYNADGSSIIFHDWKGYEDFWRKHHTSAVTRDIWQYNFADGSYTKLSTYEGEDLYPVWDPSSDGIYYTSEMYGNSFNVVKRGADGSMSQVSSLENHPVRMLSVSNDGLLCYSYHGELYTQREGSDPLKVTVTLRDDAKENDYEILRASGSSDFSVSPNGKEIAFIYRGEVFVTSVDGSWTKRVTNTPEQERSVDFHPDGRKILYAGERDGSWNIYESEIAREDEKYFYSSTLLNEKALLDNPEEEFQAQYSPDGKEVAYLEERVVLKVLNIESGDTRTVLPAQYNYSYADGDQYYEWSPDGKWFFVEYLPGKQWIGDIGLVAASGEEEPIDMTRSGFNDWGASFEAGGEIMLWGSNRHGNTNLQGRGGSWDLYALFLTQAAWDKYRLNEQEYELWKEMKEDEGKDDDGDEDDDKKSKKKKKDDDEDADEKAMVYDMDGVHERKARLTPMSGSYGGGFLNKDGDKLYLFSYVNRKWGLYEWDLYKREMESVASLGRSFGNWELDKDRKHVYVSTGGGFSKIALAGGKTERVSVDAEVRLDPQGEREYLFEHVWRQTLKKFYVEDMQGVDWAFYKEAYEPKVKEMTNNDDFAELMSELLGELNASHTGSGAFGGSYGDDQTGVFGMLFDWTQDADGLTITEVLKNGPGDYKDSPFKAGTVVKAVDGREIKAGENPWGWFNRKAGETVLLTVSNDGKEEDVRIRAISRGYENQLLYERWVETNRKEVEELSGGKVGYVHVRGMNDASMRTVYEEALGRYYDCDALIVDTRFNGGGWLHDELATFLSGKAYVNLVPRGQDLGHEPMGKWKGKSCVLMSESNYSDAHFFPWTYKTLDIGPLIGTPVAGTATAVWWETLMNNSMYFGIPMVGTIDWDGNYLENQELQPDYEVVLTPADAAVGKDPQLEKAVEVMLEGLE
ncbi:PD40 domain-containing protein [Cryomorphaceae bacterium]|nr:PD40 domain-containing protein [Cryomorphaceae bacterium]